MRRALPSNLYSMNSLSEQKVSERLFKPTGDGWYKHKQDSRHYIEMRLVCVEIDAEPSEWLQIIVSREDDTLKEYFGMELDEFLGMLRGEYERDTGNSE